MFALGLILCLLQTSLSLNWTATSPEEGHLNYLHDLLPKVHEEQTVTAILVMKHSQDNNCLLEQLRLENWPVLRFNEAAMINMSTEVSRQVLALICLSKNNAVKLLSSLADNFNEMREARIIVWMPEEHAEELLAIIAKQADRRRFYNVLALQPKGNSVIIHQMHPFRFASFTQRVNLSSDRIFIEHWRNFQGKKAVTIPTLEPPSSFYVTDPTTGQRIMRGYTILLMRRFCQRYNINLRTLRNFKTVSNCTNTDVVRLLSEGKIDFSSLLQTLHIRSEFPKVQSTSVLAVVSYDLLVPCGQELNSGQILVKIFPGRGVFMMLFYLVLALLETFVTSTTNYLGGRGFHIRYSGLWLNLRVIRGCLGYASPEGRVNSASLRQLLIMLTFFGLLLTSWMNAVFSTLFTKLPDYQNIETFEQLAESQLPVLIDWSIKYHIEKDKDFLNKKVPNAVFISPRTQTDLILSLNTSYAYLTFSFMWNSVFYMQQVIGRKILCKATAEDFGNYIPLASIVQQNSVFGLALDRFIINAQSSGLNLYWRRKTYEDIFLHRAHLMRKLIVDKNSDCSLWAWQWKLLFIGLGGSSIVFIGELIVKDWQKRRLAAEENSV
ncbi:uncharacterized protein LOC132792697 [Drosophila nasuta]|uniref:uncharacterized protein LOC132792697 n=1 Tax=Drosophila nasuta TaxID=42062 RepID=UPI00295EB8C9|nr:uncharacterized protein LOC132792697 [Drosophila nasuta]